MNKEIQNLIKKINVFIQENMGRNISADNVKAMAELTKALALLVMASTCVVNSD